MKAPNWLYRLLLDAHLGCKRATGIVFLGAFLVAATLAKVVAGLLLLLNLLFHLVGGSR